MCAAGYFFRMWGSLRLTHMRDWVEGWVAQSVSSLGMVSLP